MENDASAAARQRAEAAARHRADLATAKAHELWPAAVAFTREVLGADGVAKVRELRAADPDKWYAPYHFFAGMAVRNRLRQGGYGEAEFGVDNLDNIYVELMEEATE